MTRWVPLIIRNAVRNKRRTSLTILSISAGFCLLGVLMAMYRMFFLTSATPDEALRLFVRHKVSITNWVPLAYKKRIESIPGVVSVATFQYYGGQFKDTRDPKNTFGRFGVDVPEFLRIYREYRLPEEQKVAFIRERNACMVGRSLANSLGFKLGDRVHFKGDIFPVDLELVVRAIYDSKTNNDGFFFHFEYLTEGLRFRDFAGMYVLLVDRPESVTPVARAIDDMFRNSTAQTKTESEKAFQLSFLNYLGNVKAFLLVVCCALTLTVLMVAANTMGMAVRERIRETGVLKTLGFTPRDILSILLGESVMISLIGAGLGLTLAWFIVNGLRTLPSIFVDMKGLEMHPGVILVAAALAIFEGVASAWVPAYDASRVSIIDALGKQD